MEPGKILIVEDKRSIALELKLLLENLGYTVVGIESFGDRVHEHALSLSPDLILMEVAIKGTMDGVQAARQIRNELDIPVVFLTAHSDEKTIARAVETTPYGYIIRPFEKTNLHITIQIALIRHRMEKKIKTAEKRLQEGEKKYRDLVEGTDDLITTVDKNGILTFVNYRAKYIYGISPNDCIGRSALDFIHPDDQERTRKWIEDTVSKHEKSATIENRQLNRNGKIHHVLWTSTFHYTKDGTLLNVSGIGRDITERKQAEEMLRRNEERYRIVAKFAYDWEYWLGPEGDLKYTAPSCERVAGYTPEDFFENPSLLSSIVHEDDREAVVDHLKLDSKQNRDTVTLDFRIVTPDGQVKWINHYCVPVYADDGTFMGRRASNRDITDRKLNEKRLMESELRFRELFDHMGTCVAIYDSPDNGQSFIFKDMNKAGLAFGQKKKADIVGRDVCEVFPGVEALGLLDVFKRVWKAGKPEHHPSSRYQDDKLELWVENYVCKLPSGELVAIYEDTTAQKKAEETKDKLERQIQQAQKMEAVGTLAGGIAHDFNNILAAIVGYTELALGKTARDAPQYDDLQEVFQAGLRARDLVKQILTFSRQAEQKIQPVQVSLIIKEALKFLRSSLPSNIEIRRNIVSDARVLADPTQIHQVLMNLCANAKHAMQRTGGVLKVSLAEVQVDADFADTHPEAEAGPHLKLTVADSGKGMSAEVLEKIFDPFFTTKGKDEGTGLGLAVVHGIVKSCGGFIAVFSEPDKGTTFNVFLPVIAAQDRQQTEFKGPQPTGSERVLFVDDEMPLAEIGKQMLEGYGYRVSLCTSGVEALELFKANPVQFDLVITDMTMPNMSGLDLASEIISLRPEMRIILCTGFSEKITPAGAEAAGIKAFMLKPVSQDDLIHTVREVLDAPK